MTDFLPLAADDLFLHSHDLLRWITDYVDLEESLAVGSMAQEGLAHASALLEIAGIDADERHERIFARPTHDWRVTTLVTEIPDDWPDTVARSALFSEMISTLIDYLAEAGEGSVRATAEVMRSEQALHLRHWQRWVRILLRDSVTRDELVTCLVRRGAHTADAFSLPGGDPGELSGDAIPLGELWQEWQRRVKADLIELDIADVVVLPDSRRARTSVPQNGAIASLLAEVRSVRESHPDRRYEIYR